jgi:TolB protein
MSSQSRFRRLTFQALPHRRCGDAGDGRIRAAQSRRAFARRAVPAAVLAIAVLAGGCGGSDEPSPKVRAATEPARAANIVLPGGRIAFRRYLDDAQTHGAIFTINPDGTDEKQITEPPAGHVDDQPDWSPDGKRIAFERCVPDGPCQVLIVAATGGQPTQVRPRCQLRPVCEIDTPAWTPDGQLVVRLSQGRERPDPATAEVWIQQSAVALLDLDSDTQRTILERRDWTGDAGTPAVSPDGRTVLYSRWNSWRSTPADRQAMYAVALDGANHRRLTPWKLGAGDHPGFAPDETILFRSYEYDQTRQSNYWTIRPDGTDLTHLTHYKKGTLVLSTSYSPDGEWIAHATNGVDGNADVFVMRADGTDSQPVTRSKLWDSAPDWGPAGS